MKMWIKKNKLDLMIVGGILIILFLLITIAVAIQPSTPFNPVAFKIFGAPVAWYAIFILTGILSAGVLAYFEFKRKGLDTDDLFDGLLIFVPLSIIGARLFYVLFDANHSYTTFLEIIGFVDGSFKLEGLAIHGSIITVAVGLIFFTRFKKISYWTLLDIVAPGLLIGQIMGRWGNFMNQEAFGPAIQSEWVINILPNFIVKQMTTSVGVVQHPTFLYESLLNLVLFIILIIIRRKKLLKVGDMVGMYFIWYGLVRGIAIEPFRQDPLMFLGIKVNVFITAPLLVISGILIIVIKNIVKKDLPYYVDLDVVFKNISIEGEVVSNDI